MAEANDMREEFSYKIKTRWNTENNSDKIDLANNVYSAVKTFLEKTAEANGIKDLQKMNREIAMRMLRAKMYQTMLEAQQEKIGNERKLKVGTGERSEKIRTYNYPQNRVTDHRIGFTIQKLDRVIEGELDEVIEALIHYDQSAKMAGE